MAQRLKPAEILGEIYLISRWFKSFYLKNITHIEA